MLIPDLREPHSERRAGIVEARLGGGGTLRAVARAAGDTPAVYRPLQRPARPSAGLALQIANRNCRSFPAGKRWKLAEAYVQLRTPGDTNCSTRTRTNCRRQGAKNGKLEAVPKQPNLHFGGAGAAGEGARRRGGRPHTSLALAVLTRRAQQGRRRCCFPKSIRDGHEELRKSLRGSNRERSQGQGKFTGNFAMQRTMWERQAWRDASVCRLHGSSSHYI